MTGRRFHWVEQTGAPRPALFTDGDDVAVIEDGLAYLGLAYREGPAAWDGGGRTVVLPVVSGLQWAVVDTVTNTELRAVSFDFEEACRLAAEFDRIAADNDETPAAPSGRGGVGG